MKIDIVEVENESAAATGEVDAKFTALWTYDADWLPRAGTALTVPPLAPMRVLGVATTVHTHAERTARVFVQRYEARDGQDILTQEWWAAGPTVSSPLRNLFVWAVGAINSTILKACR
jgi:hypothetical protein